MLFFLQSGRTPLHCAAKYGHAQILDMLINKGGDDSVTDNVSMLIMIQINIKKD